MIDITWVVDAHTTYQAGLSVGNLADGGYSALIVKATEGSSGFYAPTRFETWRSLAEARGMTFGSYHWLNNNSSGQRQVDRYLARVGSLDGRIAALDVEDTHAPASKSCVISAIEHFFDRTGGHPLLVYSGAWWVDRYASWLHDFDLKSLGPVHLWDSHYVSGSDYASNLFSKVPSSWWGTRYGRLAPTLLQFTSKAHAGALSAVDASAFRGTHADLRRILTATGSDPRNGVSMTNQGEPMFFAYTEGQPTIVATDGASWKVASTAAGAFPAYSYEEIMSMKAQGIAFVNVPAARLDAILALPEPTQGPTVYPPVPAEPLDYVALAKALLNALANPAS